MERQLGYPSHGSLELYPDIRFSRSQGNTLHMHRRYPDVPSNMPMKREQKNKEQ